MRENLAEIKGKINKYKAQFEIFENLLQIFDEIGRPQKKRQ